MCSQEGMCCAPQCEGKTCGDDGCGGSCGSCGKLGICEDGQCAESCGDGVCHEELGEDCETCPQDCGKDTCPEPDCPPGFVHNCVGGCTPKNWLGDGFCDAELQCEQASWDMGDCSEGCIPDCAGLNCGSDGCGGSCGVCPLGSSCLEGVCGECIPDCSGKECGSDGCGGACRGVLARVRSMRLQWKMWSCWVHGLANGRMQRLLLRGLCLRVKAQVLYRILGCLLRCIVRGRLWGLRNLL